MRKLELQDAFSMSRLIKKIGVKDVLSKAYKDGKKEGATKEDIGIDVFFSIVEAATNESSEDLIYEFIGSIAEKDAEVIKHMNISELKELGTQLIEENDLQFFLQTVKKSI